MKTIAVIGAGNMGQALIAGLQSSDHQAQLEIKAATASQASADKVAQHFDIACSTDNQTCAQGADLVIVAVKPYLMDQVLDEIKNSLKADAIIVTVAAGYSLEQAAAILGKEQALVRIMPNTAVKIGQGVIAMTANDQVSAKDYQAIKDLFQGLGLVAEVSKDQFATITGLSGSSPTIVYMLIEAMADAGCQQGLQRSQAQNLAAQTVLGAAAMVVETGQHPGQLKDAVCSPAGTSIECVRKAEEKGLRSAAIEAVIAACQKAKGN